MSMFIFSTTNEAAKMHMVESNWILLENLIRF